MIRIYSFNLLNATTFWVMVYCNGGAHNIIPTIFDENGVSAKQADLFWLGNSKEYFFLG